MNRKFLTAAVFLLLTVSFFAQDWLDTSVPSFSETYKDTFDYVGFACEYGIKGWSEKELATPEVQKGLAKHAATITMGNEFKPQFIMAWWGKNPRVTSQTFTASNGVTIKTPALNGFNSVDAVLEICKKNNLKMRGHVLVWHSQTEEAFFRKDYNSSKPYVSKEEMTARQEWYIKTVLEHIAEWEKANNGGEHIIWAWDVVNEAIGDGSSSLRSNSSWYKIYGNYDFIINAFRFANKYAPSDVLLCYNDYGCDNSTKRRGMLTLLDKIIENSKTSDMPARIDVMGMQSHISKRTRVADIDKAINDFVAKGLDVHITELDIATEEAYKPEELADAYSNVFKNYVKNRKTDSNHGVSCVTIWGLNDESTWLNSPDQIKWHKNKTQYPLLFQLENNKYIPKPAFYAVINALN